jgi:dephospho-CoA kinase
LGGWAGKFVIGLTGGPASGKRMVSRMLARLGAYVIDVDALFRRAISREAPGYQPVLEAFGEWLLDEKGEIDVGRMKALLAGHPDRRLRFEAIVQPLVEGAIDLLAERSSQSTIVIQATDLLEASLKIDYDSVWAATASPAVQVAGLMRDYHLSREQAQRLVNSDSSRNEAAAANIRIYNDGSEKAVWKQVKDAWLDVSIARHDKTVNVPLLHTPPFVTGISLEVPSGLESGKGIQRATAATAVEPAYAPTSVHQPTAESIKSRAVASRFGLRLIMRRLSNMAMTLLVIAYLTSFGLILAERGREHLPAQPLNAFGVALLRVYQYIFQHPTSYYWHKGNVSAPSLVLTTLGHSAGLLIISLGVALTVGMSLGIAAALSKRKTGSSLMMIFSVLGVSTPSFLLAMLFWIANINVHRAFNVDVLPATGFGWDAHLIMPALVLAMRPLAQIAQITYVSLSDVLRQDYIRTARAKGLGWRLVRDRHAVRNIMIPTLTTLGTSLRFSLASLPVVELFFNWPGVGLILLQAIEMGLAPLVIDLILSLGLFFMLVNLAIEMVFPLLDARLRENGGAEEREDRTSFLGWWRGVFEMVGSWGTDVWVRVTRKKTSLPLLPLSAGESEIIPDREPAMSRRRWVFKSIITNPSLIVGSLLVLGLVGLVFFGGRLTQANPYETHGVMTIAGQVYAPPFKPSSVFPWGSDYVGRDIQALVLLGAKQTMALAFFGMLARVLLGASLGLLAGWQRNGWLDRLVTGAVGVWAAFPVTLFAMIMIQGLGIQQGMWVFIVTISIVGWGEVAQFVRSQVVTIKPQLYIEAARSEGARSDQILVRHVVPNLINSLIVLAVLEMGGVLMLLAELGYLNIFLGGGFSAMIGEVGRMVPVIVRFSDVPEWAALIANVRDWWRSYPWMALYPGMAFFLSIMAFNLAGEGLRRFLEDSQVNLSRIFNRYTMTAATLTVLGMALLLRSTTPLGMYRAEALKFDEQRVMTDIQQLSSPEFQGRETGTPGAKQAAQYIAQRMQEVGLLPGSEGAGYIQTLTVSRYHLVQEPVLQMLDAQGNVVDDLIYHQDFNELVGISYVGEADGPLVGLAFGPGGDLSAADPYQIRSLGLENNVVLVHKEDLDKVPTNLVGGILVIADDPLDLLRKDLFPANLRYWRDSGSAPVMVISREVADRLLQTTGSSLSDLENRVTNLNMGEAWATQSGGELRMSVLATAQNDSQDEHYYNVIGVIPGKGHFIGLEDQVIIVSAYYDGLGVSPDGRLYPGANDNASGVATMLELARVLKASAYQPDKTVIFVAWAGGERSEGLSVTNIMNARPGANQMTVEAVVELSGVGAGDGQGISLGETSSYRLVKLFQGAASRFGLQTTTRGRGPHYGQDIPPGFGGRSALTLSISWNGSDYLAHTPMDTYEMIDPQKLRAIGQPTLLSLFVISRETNY